ncbi:hypothetical protein P152DRAFT_446679 [Eremomyces bilateralis CBS 781.70]|uniref:Azaphilone pigments biosynthesis cluster protein L N-terminal domain-containing protein n=1 Tax=Eremomyces bilateralis CBS 781.70 TaxID=1392243 RepID=A0A6G1GC79_9PEZI|nr:uncharacterized protein P152DRAFT_446679 [Eremomyces bilateralis CBS 781.70]KAF1815634.1 hypothetical protein P152DRAFT_446679 [Eremomyces bilateralis CBS 781.70]
METAASVIAVVTISFKMATGLYRSFSDINGAPGTVKRFASSLDNLARTLEQLARLRVVRDHGSVDGTVYLKQAADKCSSNLEYLRDEWKRFKVSSPNNRLQVSWGMVRTSLKDGDIQKWHAMIREHIATLLFQLCCLSSETNIDNFTAVRDIIERVKASQDVTHNRIAALEVQLSQLTGLESDTKAIRSQTVVIRDRSVEIQQTVTATAISLESVHTKLEHMREASQSQITNLNSLIETCMKVAASSTGQDSKVTTSHVRQCELDDDAFLKSLSRLSHLDTWNVVPNPSAEAEDIISGLECLLDAAMSNIKSETTSRASAAVLPQLACEPSAEETEALEKSRVLRRLRGILGSSMELSVNSRAQAAGRSAFAVTGLHEQLSIRLRSGELKLLIRKNRTRDKTYDGRIYDRQSHHEQLLGIDVLMDFISQDPSIPFRLVANFAQSWADGICCSSVPVLWAYNIRSRREMRQLWREMKGSGIDGVKRFFQARKASPRDIDTCGKTFLAVSDLHLGYQWLKSSDIPLTA